MSEPVCAVVGVGPGNGAAFARKFAGAGYRIALLGRTKSTLDAVAKSVPGAGRYRCDVTDTAQVRENLAAVKADMGPVAVLLYNAGFGAFGTIDDITEDAFEAAWRTNALGLLAATKAVAGDMRTAGEGAIIVTGATASLRGGAGFAAFASAKAAQRSLAQSMARHLGSDGIHVALVIVDGVIDLPRTRKAMPDRPDERFLKPDAIADSVLALVRQDRSAWTFELDLRPHSENW